MRCSPTGMSGGGLLMRILLIDVILRTWSGIRTTVPSRIHGVADELDLEVS